jgi:ribosomal protein S4
MTWARKPDSNVRAEEAVIKKPSAALKVGDVIQVKVVAPTFRSERLDKLVAEQKKKQKINLDFCSMHCNLVVLRMGESH